MIFEYDQYFRNFLIIPLIGLLLSILLLCKFLPRVIRFLKNVSKDRLFANEEFYTLLFFMIVALGLLIIHIPKFGRGNLFLFLEKEEDAVYKTGKIEEIVELNTRNGDYKYSYESGEESITCFGAVLIIDGEKYNIQCYGNFNVGDDVEIKFLPQSKVILELQYVTVNSSE